ncbi:MAG: UPF0147 family protein [Nanoarchaeota archaeon]|nr:UPF0147 family protein [Nanoarchaeota archaeon]
MEDIEQVLGLLSSIGDDSTVPKNVRFKVNETICCLKDNQDSSDVVVDRAIQFLDELSNDPNIPMFTRTQLWSAISALESK